VSRFHDHWPAQMTRSIRARIDALVKYLESIQERRASNRDPNAMLAQ
jgi:hypothetical protein